MRNRLVAARAWPLLLIGALGASCAPSPDTEPEARVGGGAPAPGGAAPTAPTPTPSTTADVRPPAEVTALTQGDTVPEHPSWTEEDWTVFERTVRHAREQRWDALPVGERMVRIGELFVGTAYIPQTLDPPGPERLVINLRALDCVTFVENAMALAHFVKHAPPDVLARRGEAMDLYARTLETIRYRDGKLGEYPTRLHYFSEWIRDAGEKGLALDVTKDLGGVVDPEPITFMTGHRDAYRQIKENPSYFDQIAQIEQRLNQQPRFFVPKAQIKPIASRIQNGDVIAATSTLAGLDIAHTGIAIWKDGQLHLMHAPLVGKNVEISEKPLADRIMDITRQDGIIVTRPLETSARPGL